MYGLNQGGGFRAPSPSATVLILLVFIALTAFEAVHYISLRKVAAQYHSAPGCADQGANADSSLPPCTVSSYTVLQPYQHLSVSNNGRHTHVHSHLMLDIQAASGNRLSVEMEDSGLWASIKPGDSVKVQLWQGESRLVYANGQASPTSHNPDYQASSSGWVLVILVLIGLAFIGFFVYGAVSSRRMQSW